MLHHVDHCGGGRNCTNNTIFGYDFHASQAEDFKDPTRRPSRKATDIYEHRSLTTSAQNAADFNELRSRLDGYVHGSSTEVVDTDDDDGKSVGSTTTFHTAATTEVSISST